MNRAIHSWRGTWVATSGQTWKRSLPVRAETFKCASKVEFRCLKLTLESWPPTRRPTSPSLTFSDQSSRICIQSSTLDTLTSSKKSKWSDSLRNWTKSIKWQSELRNLKGYRSLCVAISVECPSRRWWHVKQSCRSRGASSRYSASSAVNTTKYLG